MYCLEAQIYFNFHHEKTIEFYMQQLNNVSTFEAPYHLIILLRALALFDDT